MVKPLRAGSTCKARPRPALPACTACSPAHSAATAPRWYAACTSCLAGLGTSAGRGGGTQPILGTFTGGAGSPNAMGMPTNFWRCRPPTRHPPGSDLSGGKRCRPAPAPPAPAHAAPPAPAGEQQSRRAPAAAAAGCWQGCASSHPPAPPRRPRGRAGPAARVARGCAAALPGGAPPPCKPSLWRRTRALRGAGQHGALAAVSSPYSRHNTCRADPWWRGSGWVLAAGRGPHPAALPPPPAGPACRCIARPAMWIEHQQKRDTLKGTGLKEVGARGEGPRQQLDPGRNVHRAAVARRQRLQHAQSPQLRVLHRPRPRLQGMHSAWLDTRWFSGKAGRQAGRPAGRGQASHALLAHLPRQTGHQEMVQLYGAVLSAEQASPQAARQGMGPRQRRRHGHYLHALGRRWRRRRPAAAGCHLLLRLRPAARLLRRPLLRLQLCIPALMQGPESRQRR